MYSLLYDGTSVSYPAVRPYNVKPCSTREEKSTFLQRLHTLTVRPKNGRKGRNEYTIKSVSNAGSGFSTQHDGFFGEDIFSTNQSQGVFQKI